MSVCQCVFMSNVVFHSCTFTPTRVNAYVIYISSCTDSRNQDEEQRSNYGGQSMPRTLSLLSESQKVKSYNNWFVTIRETNHQQGLQSCLLIQLVENGHQAAPPPSHIIIRTVYCEGILSLWLSFPECSSSVEIYAIEVSWILQEPRALFKEVPLYGSETKFHSICSFISF